MKTETETALDIFKQAMDAKLKRHAKDRGDNWVSCDLHYLLRRLLGEHQEFLNTINFESAEPNYDRKELVDVANFCMMLWYRDFMREHEPTFERMGNR